MGKILPRSASADRIKTATSKALLAARARGGEIQTLAEARIGEVAAALADNEQKLPTTMPCTRRSWPGMKRAIRK